MDDEKQTQTVMKKITDFLRPLEEKVTGIGLPVLFSFLATLTGAGVIVTAPMGAGKTLIARILEELYIQTQLVNHVIPFQEFKKTDWIRMFPQRVYKNESFFFCVSEISSLSEYSQQMFLEKIPALQSDGTFEYGFGKEKSEVIQMNNCKASYFIASQPPKTSHLINNTSFKTLANDRCWNILIINQLRGKKNVRLSEIPELVKQIKFKTEKKKDEKTFYKKNYFKFAMDEIKFTGPHDNKRVDFITDSNINLTDLENMIRNQFSPDRRDEQMNSILKAFGSFLNVKTINEIHVKIFTSLFGFYVNLFNKLTSGSVEQSISIKYGAMEMLCRISALTARDKLITQDLLCKEFNTTESDVWTHLDELVKTNVLKSKNGGSLKPVLNRVNKSKTPQAVRKTTNELSILGMIEKRRITMKEAAKRPELKKNQVVYEFTTLIDDFFKIYANILEICLPKSSLNAIPQIEKFLPKENALDKYFEDFGESFDD